LCKEGNYSSIQGVASETSNTGWALTLPEAAAASARGDGARYGDDPPSAAAAVAARESCKTAIFLVIVLDPADTYGCSS
jgi:hypothetical protein